MITRSKNLDVIVNFLKRRCLVGKKKIKNVKNKEKRKLVIAYVFSRIQISQVIQVAGLSAIGRN